MKKIVMRVLALSLVAMLMVTCALADTIKFRDKGEAVETLQIALTALGYYEGDLDGKFGNDTLKAVKAFQKAEKLTVDGKAGKKTQSRLTELTGIVFEGNEDVETDDTEKPTKPDTLFAGDYRTMAYGTAGARVRILQRALLALGFQVEVDADFGSTTSAAVRAFQTVVGLTVDGKAGKKTLQKIETYFDADGNCLTGPIAGNKPAEPEKDPDAPAYGLPERTLKYGDEGLDVKYVMERLYDLGYYNKKADEKFGAGMLAAVKAFQKKNGLTVDGLMGKKSVAALFSSDVLDADDLVPEPVEKLNLPYKKGDKGDEVKQVQIRLLELGYSAGKADGIFGAKTQSAVRMFQARNALTVDGKVGQRTLDKLFSESAVPAKGGAPVQPEIPEEEETPDLEPDNPTTPDDVIIPDDDLPADG